MTSPNPMVVTVANVYHTLSEISMIIPRFAAIEQCKSYLPP